MATIRQQITALLTNAPCSARDLSQLLRISERQVYDHLDHIARSVSGRGLRLRVLPIRCLTCGYQFVDRKRFTPPGRCPRCKHSHIQEPRYEVR